MRMKMILCMSLLAVSCLCGCSQNEKVSLSETYDSENISAINMQIDSWQLKIMASADDDDAVVRHIMPHTRCSVCMGQACPAPWRWALGSLPPYAASNHSFVPMTT